MGSLLLDVTVKGTLVLLATGAVVAALRGASAATRHAVWTMGMAGALLLPALSRLLPVWSVGMIPAGGISSGTVGAAPGTAGMDLGAVLASAWAIGAAVVIASIALGRLRIWWITRRSAALDHGEIPALATVLCGEIGISRRVSIRLCSDRVMPMVWGVLRPVVLLPAEAAGWPAELKRDVLLHELAHVRRHDYLNQLIARLACAVHWFNPLAWVAARRLRAERERACDDHVLRTGASACDYAEHLVAVARRLRPASRGTLGVAMAGRSAFGERVAALLDSRRARGVLTTGLLLRSGFGAACLIVPLAALHPDAGSPAADEPPPAQLVGPPPSANARAAGALPEASPRQQREAPVEEPRQARPPRTARPAERAAVREGDGQAVALVQAPAIRAVFRTVGSGDSPEIVVVPDRSAGGSTECDDSSHPASQSAEAGRAPKLVWIPTASATP
jgi:beta-lactamase regulating signal transducer with metallopeptidase domain